MGKFDHVAGYALYSVLILCLLIYWPGLDGTFLLDDIPNLQALKEFPQFPTFDRILLFIQSSHSGPLGRPISLLSFTIHDNYWPTEPRPLLLTNVLLHLLNGCLVFWLVHYIAQTQNTQDRLSLYLLPLLVSGLWLLHPLQVSTVLYVIQRMTILASLFMLFGLLLYVKGRLLLIEQPRVGYSLMSLGVLIGLGLGVLSKESASMLPIYIIVIEYLLLRSRDSVVLSTPHHLWLGLFVFLPILGMIVWHVIYFESIQSNYDTRIFNMAERLLTQPRVLFDYILSIVIPNRSELGLFHDDYVISRSFSEPLTTGFAIIALIALCFIGIVVRKNFPVASFGIFWFLGGHLLEAGVIPLEIYFEHRNYLPILGLLFILGVVIIKLLTTSWKTITGIASVVMLVLFSLVTWQNTSLFGQPAIAAEIWADEKPASYRAQALSAYFRSLQGDYSRAGKRLSAFVDRKPETTSAYIILYQIQCLEGKSLEKDFSNTIERLRNGIHDRTVPAALQKLIQLKKRDLCPSLSYHKINQMIQAILNNPNFRKGRVRQLLLGADAQIAASLGDYPRSLRSLDMALKFGPNYQLSVSKARILAGGGFTQAALHTLEVEKHRQQANNVISNKSYNQRIDAIKQKILAYESNRQQ